MRDYRIGLILTAVLVVATVLVFASPALGIPDVYGPQWKTTGSGGNHQWATSKAMAIASARGAGWVDGSAIDRSADPDTVFFDFIDHNANWWGSYPSYFSSSWGNRFGNPQGKVQEYYNLTVAALRRGDRIEASKNIGYASHYLIDVNGPLHTESSARETREFHNGLEGDASNFDFSGYIADDGYQYYGGQSSPSALVVANANSSHDYYWDLIGSYASQGFSPHVRDIEGINLNRGVNGVADLIQSAQQDADSVTAVIDSVSPSSSTTGTLVAFAGHGADAIHAITEYRWRSSNDGPLSSAASFTWPNLTMGIHNIYLAVKCSGGLWSYEAFTPFVVGAANTKPLPVYRFLNRAAGVHFYTADEGERRNVQNTLSGTYSLEGAAYALDTSSTVNNAPLYRFFDVKRGVHFYTADVSERDTIINTLGNVYHYDGPSFNVSHSAVGTQPVWRFYNMQKGVHFYTADLAERDAVIAGLGHIYHYEGVAYYFDPPW